MKSLEASHDLSKRLLLRSGCFFAFLQTSLIFSREYGECGNLTGVQYPIICPSSLTILMGPAAS